jgi:alkylation response protein AidB-like acyl-CoA dehydrogenase
MSPQPSYPKDASVGGAAAGADKEAGEGIPAAAADSGRTKKLVAGAAIGIGSAAIVAALLYAKKRKGDR